MPILSLIIWVPVAGMALIVLLPRTNAALIRWAAIATSGITFLLTWGLLGSFERSTAELQFVEKTTWVAELGMTYHIGIDGLSFPMILLAALLGLVAIVASSRTERNPKGYFAWMLMLEASILGVFMAQDWFLFYVFWELALVPMLFLLGVWGGNRKERAAVTFFLYTLAGSIFMLLGIFAIYLESEPRSFDMVTLAEASGGWSRAFQLWPFIAFFVGFGVKIPAFPLHGWLPLAHTQAPPAVCIMLSGVMLKLGAYGLLRVADTLPLGLREFLPWMFTIAIVNILYGALMAWRQTDLKAVIAYSSISHMGFVLLGIATLDSTGLAGAMYMMLAHGVITGGMFLLVGIVKDRTGTSDLACLGGLAHRVPVFAGLLTLALMGSMGLPGLAQFVGELQALIGAFDRWGTPAILASLGVVLTAGVTLRIVGSMFSRTVDGRWGALADMNRRELTAMVPLSALTIVLGVYPSLALGLSDATIRAMTALVP